MHPGVLIEYRSSRVATVRLITDYSFTEINDEQKFKILRGTKSDESVKTHRAEWPDIYA